MDVKQTLQPNFTDEKERRKLREGSNPHPSADQPGALYYSLHHEVQAPSTHLEEAGVEGEPQGVVYWCSGVHLRQDVQHPPDTPSDLLYICAKYVRLLLSV